jgi:hypothetical protein
VAGDVLIAATKLPFECPVLDLANATEKSVEDYRKVIESRALKWLQDEVDSSVKLYLLHGRREPQKDKPAAQKTLFLRHYLSMVKTQEHREAMTSIMLSTHQLALEKLRMLIMHCNLYLVICASVDFAKARWKVQNTHCWNVRDHPML